MFQYGGYSDSLGQYVNIVNIMNKELFSLFYSEIKKKNIIIKQLLLYKPK